ncbi:IclR family transcriptional regulator [Rhodobacteraceae bacterium RKSG542]|uniref:IclR family transcriptional regulator n=1 Tax=Pseudovibrio flavus TaxID=2529854 RepID=UPI0012BC2C41|nr:IclR family transcriptional regulator [Pseudovibrio flavus]MTI15931.1 IclR family transcriptional regulator [Pseudovibrio flavus]
MTDDQSSKYAAPALEKGLDILELLSGHPNGLTQKEIANALGRSVSQIFRMVSVLRERRYIEQIGESDIYALTSKLFALAHRAPRNQKLISEALPRLKYIAQKCLQSCHIAVFHQGELLIVEQVDSPEKIGYHVDSGALFDFFESSSGNVIFAYRDEAGQKKMFQDLPTTAKGKISERTLYERVQTIRREGMEEHDSDVILGVRNLSLPIFDYTGQAVAALTVPYLFKRFGQEQMPIEEVRSLSIAAARELSLAMGALEESLADWDAKVSRRL